jgi:hypothetical protein
MEIRFKVPDDVINDLKEKLNQKSSVDVLQEALTLLKWATGETEQGKMILSGTSAPGPNNKVENIQRITTPGLSNVRPQK